MKAELIAYGQDPLQDIYTEPYIADLLTVIKNKGDIEEFIVNRDKKNRDEFVATANAKRQNSIDENNNSIKNAEDRVHMLQEEKRVYEGLISRIGYIKSLYPKDKQKKFEDVLSSIQSKNGLSEKIAELTTPQKGFMGLVKKITQGKQLKQANEQFSEFIQYCKENNVLESQSKIMELALRGKEATKELQEIEEKIIEEQGNIKLHQQKVHTLQDSIKKDIDTYDNDTGYQQVREQESNIIRQFAKQKEPYINNPSAISKAEIAANGLSEEFIEGQVMQSSYAGNVRASIRRFYEGLDRPAAPMVAFCYGDRVDKRAQQEIIDKLKEMGINAVSNTDEKAKDPTVFVVTEKSIQAPFMAPDEALKANIKMIEAICQSEHAEHPFLSNPLTREAMATALDGNFGVNMSIENVAMNNGCDWEQITNGDIHGYFSTMINEAYSYGKDPGDLDTENAEAFNKGEAFKSVFHGGKCSDPYAVLCSEDNMNFVYGAGGACGDAWTPYIKYNDWQPDGALGYSFGKSSHNVRHLSIDGIQFGFLCEYESRGDKQEFIGIDRSGAQTFGDGKLHREDITVSGGRDETTVLPHQNKLKKIYITTRTMDRQTRVFPLEVDENGQVKDKRWRDFLELTKPIDDNLKGFMVERRNNMIKDYDVAGKEKFMNRTLEEINSQKLSYVKAEKREFKPYTSIPQAQEYNGAMPPPIPQAQEYSGAMPPPIPQAQEYNSAMPPPIPQAQEYNGAMPPPIPQAQEYNGAMPPPIPQAQEPRGVTPPPIPSVEQTTKKFAEMTPKEQGKVIMNMRKGVNPLLPKEVVAPALVNTQSNIQSRSQINSALRIFQSNQSQLR